MIEFGDHVITIDGEEVKVTLDEFRIQSVGADMDEVGARMSWLAAIWGAAEEERERLDAEYRNWRARTGEKLTSDLGSEWKVKQAIEADKKFLEYKKHIARAIRNCTLLKGLFSSLEAKSRMLQSKSATMRAELSSMGGGGGYHREDESETRTRRKARDKRVADMFDKKRKKVRTGSDEEA